MTSKPAPANAAPAAPLASAEVQAILEALRQEVRARHTTTQSTTNPDSSAGALVRELERSIEQLEITRVVSAHWPLVARSLPQRSLFLVHKVVRRALRWYINPIVEQQNEFNDTAARTIRLLAEAQTDLLQQLAAMQQHDDDGDNDDTPPPGAGSAGDTDTADTDDTDDTDALHALITARAAAEPPAAFPDRDVRAALPHLRQRQEVCAHWLLDDRGAVQRAAALVQKAIRFYLRWLINPIVEQQNSFNAALALAAERQTALDGELRAWLAALRAHRAGAR